MSRIGHIHDEYYNPDRYFNDAPAIDVIREEKRKARLCHTCHCCGRPITPGTFYNYFFILDCEAMPPRTFSSHQHIICPEEVLP